MGVVIGMMVARLPQKYDEEEPEHIKGREESREDGGAIKNPVARDGTFMDCVQYGVLGEEPGEGRNPGNSQVGDQESSRRNFHFVPKAAHLPNVLVMHSVNNAPGPEKQKGFETGVGGQVEHSGSIAP